MLNLKSIAVRALVTAAEAFLGAVLATGLTDLSVSGAEFAALSALGAGLSVVYNALSQLKASYEGQPSSG